MTVTLKLIELIRAETELADVISKATVEACRLRSANFGAEIAKMTEQDVFDRLNDAADDLLSTMKTMMTAVDLRYQLRTVIANTNDMHGVPALLAKRNAAESKVKNLQAILSLHGIAYQEPKIILENMNVHIEAFKRSGSVYDSVNQSFSVLNDDMKIEINRQIRDMNRLALEVKDSLAAINRTAEVTLSLEVWDEVQNILSMFA